MAAITKTKPGNHGSIAGATVALVLLTAMNFVNYLDRYILPAVQEQVKGEFHLSDHQIGMLTTWFMIAYMCSSPVTGWLGDRFPRKPMIVIAALAIAAMNFFTASVHDYASLNFRHAALGIGEASFGIFAPALLADYYSEAQRNKVLTIFNMALPFGAACSYEAGAWVGAHYGWRMSFITSAIPGALVGLLILLMMKEPKRGEGSGEKAKTDKASVLSLATNGAYLSSILGYAAVTFSLGGISWWMPSFLQREAGYSQAAAGGVMGPIIVVAGLGGTAFGGWLAQRWSKKTPKALYLVPALSAALTVPPALLCFFGPKAWIVPTLSLAVFFIFLGTGPINAATLNAVPAHLRATAMAGQLLMIHLLGDAPASPIIGEISDHSNLRVGLGATLITMVIAAVIFFFGARFAPPLHDTLEAKSVS
ncbi:MAG TPA: MFS transporter [Acidobacteriaceae bacterium]|jgi:MFS family permease